MKFEKAIKVSEKQAKSSKVSIGFLLGNIRKIGKFGYSEEVVEAYKVYKNDSDANNGFFY